MVWTDMLKELDERFHHITIIPCSEIVQSLLHKRGCREHRGLDRGHDRCSTWNEHANDRCNRRFNLQYAFNHLLSFRRNAFNISHFHSPYRGLSNHDTSASRRAVSPALTTPPAWLYWRMSALTVSHLPALTASPREACSHPEPAL